MADRRAGRAAELADPVGLEARCRITVFRPENSQRNRSPPRQEGRRVADQGQMAYRPAPESTNPAHALVGAVFPVLRDWPPSISLTTPANSGPRVVANSPILSGLR